MDGAWTGHPDQNAIAVAQFPVPEPVAGASPGRERYPDLRPRREGVGKTTVTGTRAAMRTVIRYRHGVLERQRREPARRLHGRPRDRPHLPADDRAANAARDLVPVEDESGQPVKHTPQLITQLFDEELERLLAEVPADADPEEAARLRRAREISEAMIIAGEFNPV